MTPEKEYILDISGGWPWPIWVTVLLVIVVIYFLWRLYRQSDAALHGIRRLILFSLRAAIVLIIIAMIGQWVLIRQRTTRPILAVIVDDSASMAVKDIPRKWLGGNRLDSSSRPGEFMSRWEALVECLGSESQGLLKALDTKYRLKVFPLDENAESGNTVEEVFQQIRATTPQRASTPLGRTILGVIDRVRGSEPAAVVVISDGVCNEGPTLNDVAEDCRQRGIPLFFLGLGDPSPRPDVWLQNWIMEDRVFAQDKVVLRAEVGAEHVPDKQLTTRLIDLKQRSVLAEKKVSPPPTGRAEVVLLFVAPGEGQVTLELECVPVAGEDNIQNNRLIRTIWVENKPIRVLLIGYAPSFEYRFLKNTLGREGYIQLNSILLSADPEIGEEFQAGLSLIRGARQQLWSYDVILLVDVPSAAFPPRVWGDLAGFIDENDSPGGLVVIAGANVNWSEMASNPLSRVLPIQSTYGIEPTVFDKPRRVVPTKDGWRMPWLMVGNTEEESRRIWEQLPGVYLGHLASALKPGARALATLDGGTEGAGGVVFAFQYVGRGRVLYHGTDETWRWRKVAQQSWYRQFWVDLVRCMARGKLEADLGAVLSTDRSVYPVGAPVRFTLQRLSRAGGTQAGDEINIWLQRDGQERRSLTLRRSSPEANTYEAVAQKLTPGYYQAWLPGDQASIRTTFTVLPPKREIEDTRPAWQEMKEAAQRSGGRLFDLLHRHELIESLPPGKMTPVEFLPPLTLWNRPVILGTLIILLAIEWVLRKLWGLL